MRKEPWLALGALLAALLLVLGLTTPAQSQRGGGSLPARIAKLTKVKEADVVKVLNALGPAAREDLARGESVSLPGLGTLQVVRIAEHRDLRDGRPVTVPATNTVVFHADGIAIEASNAPDVIPAETVPAFEYNVLPGATRGQRTPNVRSEGIRTRP